MLLFFFFVLLLAYLPVGSFLFFLKNDAFNGYYPAKYFISESLSIGEIPWWNPYINFGLPQYGDMNSGFWSPVTWLMALTIGYSPYSFTIELLFYLFAAGCGMYVLCRSYKLSTTVCFISGTAFMCSGYMTGHLQHFNWISGAAILPWCLWAFNRLQKRPSFKNIILCACIFYLFAASAHPGLIIGGLYFFIAYIIFYFFKQHQESSPSFKRKFLIRNSSLLLILLILSAGMIMGYADILPHITRGEKLSNESAMANPVAIQNIISTLLPMSVMKNDAFFATDISMRNFYIGLVPLLFYFTAAFGNKSREQLFFLITGIVFFLLSLGGVFKIFSHHLLPLMSYVRLNGEFAVFSSLSMILVAAFSLDNYIRSKPSFSGALKKTAIVFETICWLALAAGIIGLLISKDGFVFQLNHILAVPGIGNKLKNLVDSISFYDTFWMQAGIQLLLFRAIKKSLRHAQRRRLLKLVVIEMIIATLLNIPFTGVGKASVRDVELVLNKAPYGIPIPMMNPISENPMINTEQAALTGDWSFYNKQPGNKYYAFYPVRLKNSDQVYKDTVSIFAHKPFLFSNTDSNANSISIMEFDGNKIELSIDCGNPDTLTYQQNIYPHWKISVNGEQLNPIKGRVFLSVPLQKGKNFVSFNFEPALIVKAMQLSGLALAICTVLLITLLFKRPSPS